MSPSLKPSSQCVAAATEAIYVSIIQITAYIYRYRTPFLIFFYIKSIFYAKIMLSQKVLNK